jgi:hypothetical protein
VRTQILLFIFLIGTGACGVSTPLVDAGDTSANVDALRQDARDAFSSADGTTDGSTSGGDGMYRPACDESIRDGSTPDVREEVASIRMTRSTNSAEIDVAVYSDGSAERTVGELSALDAASVLDPAPKTYPPGSPEVLQFLCDLAIVGDVSAIPADPGLPFPSTPGCAKSASFGTITTVTAGGKTSGDLECLENPTTAVTALAQDVAALLGKPLN